MAAHSPSAIPPSASPSQFGFCYGVERAIDLAYASRRVFRRQTHLPDRRNHPQPGGQPPARGDGDQDPRRRQPDARSTDLGTDDVVIVPAFGAPTELMDKLNERGCMIVDTTCGDVMKVWRRVRQYARERATSIIHGKAAHEETRATASRALGDGAVTTW